MESSKDKIGLLIERRKASGCSFEYVTARAVRREEGQDSPLGFSSMFDHSGLDGLQMEGFISEYEPYNFIGYEPGYSTYGTMHLPQLVAMQKMLKKVAARICKDGSSEAGDMLMSVAHAIGAEFVVERIGDKVGMAFSDSQWRWHSLGDGRNRYRRMIEEARAEATAAKRSA